MRQRGSFKIHKDERRTLKSGVNVLDEIRGKDQDACMVLDLSEEDGDQGVPGDVCLVPFLQEYIGLIQKNDSVPAFPKS